MAISLGCHSQTLRDKVTTGNDVFTVVYSEVFEQPLNVKYSITNPNGAASRSGMDFYKNDSISDKNYFDYIKTNITGININAVDISIPFKNKQLKTVASAFWVNNDFVTFKLKMKNREADKMKSHLLKLGFDAIRIIQDKDYSDLVILKLKKLKTAYNVDL